MGINTMTVRVLRSAPVSGAETQREPVAFGQTDPLERADVAAAEDGRTPLNTYR